MNIKPAKLAAYLMLGLVLVALIVVNFIIATDLQQFRYATF